MAGKCDSWDSVPLWKGDERAMPFTGAVTRDAAKQGLRNGTESRDLLPLRKQNRNFYYFNRNFYYFNFYYFYRLNSLSKKIR